MLLNQETGIERFGFKYRVRKYFRGRVNGDTRNFSWGTWIPNLLLDLNVSSNTNKCTRRVLAQVVKIARHRYAGSAVVTLTATYIDVLKIDYVETVVRTYTAFAG